jgi:putative Ca2+/H+ antiporter (TMEM165/GDT1 family)
MKTYALVFVSVLLAELGDKTQLATLLFASDPAVNRAGLFAASAGALVTSSALAVVAGAYLGHWLPPGHLKGIAGIAFIAIGMWVLISR